MKDNRTIICTSDQGLFIKQFVQAPITDNGRFSMIFLGNLEGKSFAELWDEKTIEKKLLILIKTMYQKRKQLDNKPNKTSTRKAEK